MEQNLNSTFQTKKAGELLLCNQVPISQIM